MANEHFDDEQLWAPENNPGYSSQLKQSKRKFKNIKASPSKVRSWILAQTSKFAPDKHGRIMPLPKL